MRGAQSLFSCPWSKPCFILGASAASTFLGCFPGTRGWFCFIIPKLECVLCHSLPTLLCFMTFMFRYFVCVCACARPSALEAGCSGICYVMKWREDWVKMCIFPSEQWSCVTLKSATNQVHRWPFSVTSAFMPWWYCCVLMSRADNSCSLFWLIIQTDRQNADNRRVMNPSCCIVCYTPDEWQAYDRLNLIMKSLWYDTYLWLFALSLHPALSQSLSLFSFCFSAKPWKNKCRRLLHQFDIFVASSEPVRCGWCDMKCHRRLDIIL